MIWWDHLDRRGIQSVVAGSNITVDNTDPQNPVVSSTAIGGRPHEHATCAAHSDQYEYDARKVVVPLRPNAASVGSGSFDTLTGWTQANGGTGTTTIVASGSPDPAVGNVLQLSTGATAGSVASVSKDWGAIPSSFGVMFLTKLNTVGTSTGDGLVIEFTNIDNIVLSVRLNDNPVYVFQDGAYQSIFATNVSDSQNIYREHWIQVTKLSSSSWRVDLFLGTEAVGTRTGNMPGGAGTDDKVFIAQTLTAATIV